MSWHELYKRKKIKASNNHLPHINDSSSSYTSDFSKNLDQNWNEDRGVEVDAGNNSDLGLVEGTHQP